ncbi:hypothetical protein AVEN_212569-1, partial [Araneus ventricosus]
SPTIKNLPIPSSPSVFPVCEEASDLSDLTDFKIVTKKTGKDSPTKTNNTIAKAEKISKFYTTSPREVLNSIETQDKISTLQSEMRLQPRAVLLPVEKRSLQSRESDADAEMSSSSALEEDKLDTLHVRGLRGLKCSFQSSTFYQT